jgi:hypothetical protein
MGLFDGLSSMFKQPPPTVTQTNSVQYSPEQKALLAQAMPFIQQYGNQGLPQLPTNTIANFNPNEIAAQSGAINAATGQGNQLGNSAFGAQQFMLSPEMLNPNTNPYLQMHGNNIASTMNQSFTDTVLPALRSGDTMTSGPYAGGNTRAGIAEGVASGRNSQAIGNSVTDLYNRAYGQGLGAMTSAVQNNPSAQQGLLFGANVQGQVGGQQRAMDQAKLDEQNQLQMLQYQLPFLKAQDLLGLMQGMPGATGVSTTTGATPSTGGVKGALGGAASGAAIGSMFPGVGTALGALLGGGVGFFS